MIFGVSQTLPDVLIVGRKGLGCPPTRWIDDMVEAAIRGGCKTLPTEAT